MRKLAAALFALDEALVHIGGQVVVSRELEAPREDQFSLASAARAWEEEVILR